MEIERNQSDYYKKRHIDFSIYVPQPVEKASVLLAFSNKLWYNKAGDEKC